MVKWTCPWCGYIEYSAWERKEHKLVRCGRCEGEYFNPYYEARGESIP